MVCKEAFFATKYPSTAVASAAMAKSKNHTGNNQVYKNHRNGIKKTRRPKKMSMQGMNCKFVRNQAFAKRGMNCSAEEKEQRLAAQKEAQKRMEEKKAVDKANRLKELEEEKQKAALKAVGEFGIPVVFAQLKQF